MIFVFKIGFLEVSWVDIIDISLVSILLYQVYKLIRGSIAVNIFLGILALYLVYLIVRAAEMELLETILGQFMGVGVLATKGVTTGVGAQAGRVNARNKKSTRAL